MRFGVFYELQLPKPWGEAKKAAELAPYIDAALRRKKWMRPLADHEIPVIRASVERAKVG